MKRLGMIALLAMPAVMAAEIGNLHTFSAGTPARAAEVNKNFDDVKTAVNANDQRLSSEETKSTAQAAKISTVETTLAAQTSTVNALETNVASHSSAIAGLSSEQAALASSSGANTAAITALQTSTTALQGAVSSKQERVGGSCVIGESIRVINGNGTVECQKAQLAGYSGISPTAFFNIVDAGTGTSCNFNRLGNLVLRGTSNYCEAVAPLTLPHNVKLTSLSCGVLDNHGGSATTIAVGLTRGSHFFNVSDQLLYINSNASDNAQIQTLQTSDTIFGKDVVDNAQYHYYLRVFFTTTATDWEAVNGLTNKVHLRGCSVTYTAL